MNLLNYNHNIASLFILSLRIYKKNFIPILFLTIVLMTPAFILSIVGWGQTESIVFFISAHILEGAICLGIIGTTFGNFFPSIGVLRNFRTNFFIGSIHVAILQYILFIFGVIGLTLPFPLNIIVVSLWLIGLLMTYLAQPVFAVEGIRGMAALLRSIKLVKNNLAHVFFVVILSTLLQFLIFALIFSFFMPDLNININENQEKGINILLSDILSDSGINSTIRWTQYAVSLIFYPFASLICIFLYFNISKNENTLNMEYLEGMSNKLFGTPISKFDKTETTSEEDFDKPKNIKIVDHKKSTEDK